MKVAVTGATGLVGSGAVRALLAAGHEVLALTRSDRAAAEVRALGARPHRGDLADPDSLRTLVAGVGGVVHAGFPRAAHEHLDEAIALDRAATTAILGAASEHSCRVLYTSGIGVLGQTGEQPVGEDAPTTPNMRWRVELEDRVRAAGGVALRPGLVYGHGSGDILAGLIGTAREHGRAAYPAAGADNPWPHVHADDLGIAFALALTSAPRSSVYNVAAGSATPRTVHEAIGRALGVAAVPIDDPDEAAYLPFAEWLGIRQQIDTSRIRNELGWVPEAIGLIDDLERGSYRPSGRTRPVIGPGGQTTDLSDASPPGGQVDADRPGKMRVGSVHPAPRRKPAPRRRPGP